MLRLSPNTLYLTHDLFLLLFLGAQQQTLLLWQRVSTVYLYTNTFVYSAYDISTTNMPAT